MQAGRPHHNKTAVEPSRSFMSKRGVTTLVAGGALALAALIAGVMLLGWRASERRDMARAEMDLMMMRERDVALARRADDAIDWPEVAAAFTGAHPPPPGDVAEF